MEVMIIKITIAADMYALIKTGARVQLIFNHIVAISLLISNVTPITTIGMTAAEKILTRPATE